MREAVEDTSTWDPHCFQPRQPIKNIIVICVYGSGADAEDKHSPRRALTTMPRWAGAREHLEVLEEAETQQLPADKQDPPLTHS